MNLGHNIILRLLLITAYFGAILDGLVGVLSLAYVHTSYQSNVLIYRVQYMYKHTTKKEWLA